MSLRTSGFPLLSLAGPINDLSPDEFEDRYEQKSPKLYVAITLKLGAFNTASDSIMNVDDDDIVAVQLTDKELLNQFRAVEKLSPEDKHIIKTFIDAFLTKRQIQKLVQ